MSARLLFPPSLQSFIFALGAEWKGVLALKEAFCAHAGATGPSATSMNHIQAAAFLQRNGATRTALQRKDELNDIDLDHDGAFFFWDRGRPLKFT